MEIIALLVNLATGLITLTKALLKHGPAFWRWLRSIRLVRVDPSRGGRDLEGMTPLNLRSLRPRRQQNLFSQVVNDPPPMRRPKAGWPPPYEKAVVDTDFMDRRPYPTTDSTRPFAGGGASPGIRSGRPRPNLQSD